MRHHGSYRNGIRDIVPRLRNKDMWTPIRKADEFNRYVLRLNRQIPAMHSRAIVFLRPSSPASLHASKSFMPGSRIPTGLCAVLRLAPDRRSVKMKPSPPPPLRMDWPADQAGLFLFQSQARCRNPGRNPPNGITLPDHGPPKFAIQTALAGRSAPILAAGHAVLAVPRCASWDCRTAHCKLPV